MSSTANADSYLGEHTVPLEDSVDVPSADVEVGLTEDETVDLREDQVIVSSRSTAPTDIADEPPAGIHDPVFPVVVLGLISLIVILVISATLAL